MNNIKPNYFVGIRTPWNLEDETNWRKTHHLASKVWFFGGLIIGLLILLSPRTLASYILIIGTMPLALIPIYYSWSLLQKRNCREGSLTNHSFLKASVGLADAAR